MQLDPACFADSVIDGVRVSTGSMGDSTGQEFDAASSVCVDVCLALGLCDPTVRRALISQCQPHPSKAVPLDVGGIIPFASPLDEEASALRLSPRSALEIILGLRVGPCADGDSDCSVASPKQVAGTLVSLAPPLADPSAAKTLDAGHVVALAVRCRATLGLPAVTQEHVYLALTPNDRGGTNLFAEDALGEFLQVWLTECYEELSSLPSSVSTVCKVGGTSEPQSPFLATPQGGTCLPCCPCVTPADPEASAPPATPPSRALPPASPLGTPRSCGVKAPPSSPTEPVVVTFCSLAGQTHQAAFPGGLEDVTTEDLYSAVDRSPLARSTFASGDTLGNPFFEIDFYLSSGESLLRKGLSLDEQGIRTGAVVNVIRITPPPERVRVWCVGMGCGPSSRGACGTFRLSRPLRLKNDRPVYVRDPSLSQWNAALRYHGEGSRYLLYEQHKECGGRWALTDDKNWNGYADRCFAFVVCDASHPGYLEGKTWNVFRDTKHANSCTWKADPCIQLAIESDVGGID